MAVRSTLQALPDDALAAAVREDPEAFPVLLARYQRLTLHIAGSVAKNAADAEDFAQEGLLGLLSAVNSYDPSQGAGFRTYAVICIRNRILNAAKGQDALLNAADHSLDDPAYSDDLFTGEAESPEYRYLAKERISELYAMLADVLSRQELEIFSLSVSGFSYREIADRMQISEKSVDNAIQRSRRKLRAVWGRGELP